MKTSVRAIVVRGDSLLVMDRSKFGERFLTLIGGGVDKGEERLAALSREVMEETSITIANPRLVIIENAGPVFGRQYIYLSDYVSGEPALASHSIEAKMTAHGQNLYQPLWLPLSDLASANLLPHELRDLLVTLLKDGFPDRPIELNIPARSRL